MKSSPALDAPLNTVVVVSHLVAVGVARLVARVRGARWSRKERRVVRRKCGRVIQLIFVGSRCYKESIEAHRSQIATPCCLLLFLVLRQAVYSAAAGGICVDASVRTLPQLLLQQLDLLLPKMYLQSAGKLPAKCTEGVHPSVHFGTWPVLSLDSTPSFSKMRIVL